MYEDTIKHDVLLCSDGVIASPSIKIENYWMDFHEIWYGRHSLESVTATP